MSPDYTVVIYYSSSEKIPIEVFGAKGHNSPTHSETFWKSGVYCERKKRERKIQRNEAKYEQLLNLDNCYTGGTLAKFL